MKSLRFILIDRILLFASWAFWFDWSFALLDELSESGLASDRLESLLLDLVRRLNASSVTKRTLAIDDARTLDFSAKTAEDTKGVLVRVTGYFYVYHIGY